MSGALDPRGPHIHTGPARDPEATRVCPLDQKGFRHLLKKKTAFLFWSPRVLLAEGEHQRAFHCPRLPSPTMKTPAETVAGKALDVYTDGLC